MPRGFEPADRAFDWPRGCVPRPDALLGSPRVRRAETDVTGVDTRSRPASARRPRGVSPASRWLSLTKEGSARSFIGPSGARERHAWARRRSGLHGPRRREALSDSISESVTAHLTNRNAPRGIPTSSASGSQGCRTLSTPQPPERPTSRTSGPPRSTSQRNSAGKARTRCRPFPQGMRLTRQGVDRTWGQPVCREQDLNAVAVGSQGMTARVPAWPRTIMAPADTGTRRRRLSATPTCLP
jgi:hypothetical protein